MVSYSRISDSCFCSEEHIARKMGQVVAEAKAKLSKGDKKGEQHVKRFTACIVVIVSFWLDEISSFSRFLSS